MSTGERESGSIRGLLIDLDGVLYVGDRPVPGASEALAELRRSGMVLRFLTNTTTRTAVQILRKLDRLGFEVAGSEIFSALTATVDFLEARARERAEPGRPSVHLVVRDGVVPEFGAFQQVSLADGKCPDYVVLGDIGAAWDYPLLNMVFNEVMEGADMLAMHRNKYFQGENGLLMDIGAFVSGLEYVTGKEELVVGKPSADFFNLALESLGCPVRSVAVVGDDIETDVGGGQAIGLRGVLVRTGKYRREAEDASPIRPEATLDSIADLPGWVGDQRRRFD